MTVRKTAPPAKPVSAKKPAVKTASKAPPKTRKPATPPTKTAVVAARVAKPKKVKMIRDSFTMPFFDYDLIDALKVRALNSKVVLKKSEVLRAGLHALSKLDAKELIAIAGTLAAVKTGRPKK